MFTEAQRKFLASTTRAFLMVHRRDGSPTCYPMTLIFDGEALVFSTYRKSAKVKRLQRDSRLSVLAVRGDDTLLIHGTADITDGTIDVVPTAAARELQVPKAVADKAAANLASGKRCLIRVSVTSVEEG